MRDIQERYSWWIDLFWIAGVMAIAVILRVIYGGAREILIDQDSTGYIMRAREIFSGGPLFDTLKMPGYPLLIGIWSMILGDDILAAKAASIFSGSLLSVAAYFLGKYLYGRSVGITAGLLIAINAALIDVASWELSEATYTLVIFLAMAVTVWGMRRQYLAIWAFAGIIYGLAYWVRPEGFFYLGLVPLIAIMDHWFQARKALSRELVLRMSAFVLAGLLLVIPNVLYIHRETGAWTISGKTVLAVLMYGKELEGQLAYENSVYGLSQDKQRIAREAAFGKVSVFGSFSENLVFKAREMVKNWWETYNLLPSVFPIVLIPFLGIGLFQLRWTFQERRAEFYLIGSLLPWIIIYPLYNIDYENLTPIVPFLTLWVSFGIVEITKCIVSRGGSPLASVFQRPGVIIALLIVLVAALELPAYTRPFRHADFYSNSEDEPINRKVAEWIKENLPEDVTLMERKRFISIYANRGWVPFPYADYPDMITYARLRGVDVIIMVEKFKRLRPQLIFLFDPTTPLKDVVPIYTTQNERGQRIILYQLLGKKEETARLALSIQR